MGKLLAARACALLASTVLSHARLPPSSPSRRHFVLQNGELKYYTEEGGKLKGNVVLTGYVVSLVSSSETGASRLVVASAVCETWLTTFVIFGWRRS